MYTYSLYNYSLPTYPSVSQSRVSAPRSAYEEVYDFFIERDCPDFDEKNSRWQNVEAALLFASTAEDPAAERRARHLVIYDDKSWYSRDTSKDGIRATHPYLFWLVMAEGCDWYVCLEALELMPLAQLQRYLIEDLPKVDPLNRQERLKVIAARSDIFNGAPYSWVARMYGVG